MADPRVFIIHGRNLRALEELCKFIRAVGLEPWTFDQVAASLGANPFIDDVVNEGIRKAGAVVALFTPDERAKLSEDFERPTDSAHDRIRWQCRANVLYETGIARAHQEVRTLIVVVGKVELPSDFAGRLLRRLSNDPADREWLRAHFVAAGCPVNQNLDYRKKEHGDFDERILLGAAVAGEAQTSGLHPTRVDLILGPGGVRCLAFAGAIAALEKRGYTIASISAVSAGAIIGALRASGISGDDLAETAIRGEVLPDVKPPSFFSMLLALRRPFALKKPIEAGLFRRLVPSDPCLGDLQIPLAIAALDLVKGRSLAYSSRTHPKMKVSEALTLSTAVPLYYPAVSALPDRLIVDAAIQTQMPLWLPAILDETSRNRLLVFTVGGQRFRESTALPGYLARLFEAAVLASDELKVLQSRRVIRVRISVDNHGPLDRLDRDQRRDLVHQGVLALESANLEPLAADPAVPSTDQEDPHERAEAAAALAARRHARELQVFASELSDD